MSSDARETNGRANPDRAVTQHIDFKRAFHAREVDESVRSLEVFTHGDDEVSAAA
jgi:hypothetical protein